MLQLRRSTALIDLNAHAVRAQALRETPVVQVGGLGMTIVRGPRTAVGSAYDVASRLFVRAGADLSPAIETYETKPVCPTADEQKKYVDDAKSGVMTKEQAESISTVMSARGCTTQSTELRVAAGLAPLPSPKDPTKETTMTKPPPSKNALGIPQQSMLSKVATVAIVAPFVAGPPVIGYLLFGWIGAGVGAVIAAPLALGLVAYTVMG